MSAHEGGDGQLDDDKASGGEQELATRTVQIQSKRFYLDVKQNRMGRFIKIAEIYVGAGGRKSRLLLPMSTSAELCEKLTEFGEYYASLGPPNPDAGGEEGLLKSAMITKETRRYYLDLKENRRGRFLRVSQLASLTGQRSQVAIPAQGIIEIRDALTELLKQFGSDDLASQPRLPEPKTLRGENKTFYFDVGSNRRGIYLRISEVRANMRTAITIPEQNWAAFRDTINQFIESSSSLSAAGGEANQAENGATAAADDSAN